MPRGVRKPVARTQRKSKIESNKGPHKSINSGEVILLDNSPINAKVPEVNHRGRGASRPKRPVVISLDVTYSSEDEFSDEFDQINSPSPKVLKKKSNPIFSKSYNDDNILRSSVNFSSDSSGEESPTTNTKIQTDCVSDDEIFDLYQIDHKAMRIKTSENIKQLRSCEAACNSPDPIERVTVSDKLNVSNCELVYTKLTDDKEQDSNDDCQELNVSVPLNIDVSKVVLDKKCNPRHNKKTELGLKALAAYSKRFNKNIQDEKSTNDSFNDVILIDSDEVSPNLKLNLKIRWGAEYLRIPVKRNEHFATLYQHFATLHKVSVSNVVLSFNDEIIPPDVTPSDLNLNIADIIDGGIMDQLNTSLTTLSQATDDIISLKVQTSNRKDFTILNISKYDKMSVLMHNYAKLKNIKVDKLRFLFDGEIIQRDESPLDLDLEGGECIDVFDI